MNKLAKLAALILLLGFAACAQEVRHEITVQGSGFFPNETTGNGITSKPFIPADSWPDTVSI